MKTTLANKVVKSFLYVADKRPVFDFDSEADAQQCHNAIKGAEVYGNKQHVFLPTPHGLELVCGSQNGETSYMFHDSHQAKHWFESLQGYGVMYPEGPNAHRTVVVGKQGHQHGGEPMYPGVA